MKENDKPTVAAGKAEEILRKEVSQEEKNNGDYTRVTRLSWDEVEN